MTGKQKSSPGGKVVRWLERKVIVYGCWQVWGLTSLGSKWGHVNINAWCALCQCPQSPQGRMLPVLMYTVATVPNPSSCSLPLWPSCRCYLPKAPHHPPLLRLPWVLGPVLGKAGGWSSSHSAVPCHLHPRASHSLWNTAPSAFSLNPAFQKHLNRCSEIGSTGAEAILFPLSHCLPGLLSPPWGLRMPVHKTPPSPFTHTPVCPFGNLYK